MIRNQNFGNLRSVRIELENFYLGKAAPSERQEVIKLRKAKVQVSSDSVLCVGKMREFPQSNSEWESRLQWFMSTKQHRELDGIDGEPVEFEWMIFPGHTTLQILLEIQKLPKDLGCEPEQFLGRIIFMSMYNEIEWRNEDNKRVCLATAFLVATCAKKLSLGHVSFLGPGSETKWNATATLKPGG